MRNRFKELAEKQATVVRSIVKAAADRFQTEKDGPTLGALGILLIGYLLGVEKECYEALSFNRAATSGFGPRTEIEPIEDSELSSKHARESAAILACIIVFNELESEEMNEMLSWLGGLAWDGLAGELFSLVAPFVVNAAREPSAWQFLERDLPESCRLIELIDAKSICS